MMGALENSRRHDLGQRRRLGRIAHGSPRLGGWPHPGHHISHVFLSIPAVICRLQHIQRQTAQTHNE